MVRADRRVALVTSSSRGLGSAIARRLAGDGLSLAVNGLGGDDEALAVAEEICRNGGVASAFLADVTDEAGAVELVAAVAAALGPVEVLVVNATGPQPEAPLEEVSWEDHLAQLAFFVKSPVMIGRAVLPGMRASGFGRIVHVDSEVVDVPPPRRSAYVTAKSAQVGLMRSWALELAPLGITVNTVAPGFHPGRAPCGRQRGDQGRLPSVRSRGPDGTPRRHRLCRQLLRVGGGGVRNWPAARRQRRPRPSRLIAFPRTGCELRSKRLHVAPRPRFRHAAP